MTRFSIQSLSPMRRAVGLVLGMIGITWVLLGSGFISGSVMSGSVVWAIVGLLVTIGGGYILLSGQRRTTAVTPSPIPPASAQDQVGRERSADEPQGE